jgi:hypothetical protein
MRRLLALSALAVAFAAPLGAQAYTYPSMQPTRIAEREYNFMLADSDEGGTALVFQWREGLGNPKLQFTGDLGFGDPEFGDGRFILGGGLAYQLVRVSEEMPFDIVLAGGLGASFGDDVTIMRIPFGAAIGRRFALENELAISPFVHPRLSWNRVSGDAIPDSDTDTELEVDIGANLELNPRMAIRLAAVLGDADAIGIAFAWTPRGLR